MKTEQGLLAASAQWDEAIARNDIPEMNKYMSDDWVIVGSGDGIRTKAEFLSFVRSGDLVHSRMSTSETRVRIYNDAATIIARGISEGTYKGEFFSLHEWSTSVFVWETNRWVCVATMLTAV